MTRNVSCAILMFCLCMGAFAGTGNPLDGLADLKVGSSQRASSSDANWQNGNGDARPIEPGKTLTVADLEGPGVITHFWNTIAAQERGYSKLLVLRMYWDGEDNPSVECPIGDFFGIGHGVDQPYQSLPVTVTSEGRARNCYWPMPFRKSAKITVTNEGRKRIDAFYYYVDWRKLPKMSKKTAYFHAMYRQEYPALMGRNYLLADIVGQGHYVGTVLSVRQRTASWWGEGDDFFYIDGAKEPQLRGTGSEDYLCDAWGLRQMSTPHYGAPLMQGYDAYALTSAYRWHIVDPVMFAKSLKVEIEHKGVTFNPDGSIKSGFEERPDDFASVGFWYQIEPHKPFEPMPAAYDRLYFDYSTVIETESLVSAASATKGGIQTQDGGWSGGKQLFWTPAEANQTLTIPFETNQDGEVSVLLMLTKSWDYGIFQFELDGKPLGAPVDLFSASIVGKDQSYAPITIQAGKHLLTIKNMGKNETSKGYFLGIDGILIGKG